MKKAVPFFVSGLLVIAIMFSLLPSVPIKAVSYIGTLPDWKSTGSSIGRWTEPYYKIGAVTVNSNSYTFNTYFTSGMISARDQWDAALGTLSLVYAFDSNDTTFKFFGGTKSEIVNYSSNFNTWDIADNVWGVTKILSNAYWGMFSYYNGTSYVDKTGVEILGAVGCIVNKGNVTNVANKTKCSCIHEVGHAFGWYDHSASSSDVMYPTVSTNITLTNNDKNHLSQVYLENWY